MSEDVRRPVLVCRRMESLASPIAGANFEQCVDCRRLVWLAPSSVTIQREHRPHVLCLECASEGLPQGEVHVEELTDEQRAELEGGP